MDQTPIVAFTAFADLWPTTTGNGDRGRPVHHWRGEEASTFLIAVNEINSKHSQVSRNQLSRKVSHFQGGPNALKKKFQIPALSRSSRTNTNLGKVCGSIHVLRDRQKLTYCPTRRKKDASCSTGK